MSRLLAALLTTTFALANPPYLPVRERAVQPECISPLSDLAESWPTVEIATQDGWGKQFVRPLTRLFMPYVYGGETPHYVQVLLREAERGNSPYLQAYARLGFVFSKDPMTGKGKIEIPTLKKFLETYEAILKEHIANGRLTEADVLRPGYVYSLNGNIHFARIGEPKPEGARTEPIFSRPDLFFKMVKAGLFPMESDDIFGWHEVNHVVGLVENPDFMKRVKRFVEKMPVKGKDLRVRLFHTFEGLTLVNPKNRERLRSLLSPLFREQNGYHLVHMRRVRDYYKNRPVDETIRQAQTLIQKFHSLVTHYGALGRDAGMVQIIHQSEASDTLPQMLVELREVLHSYQDFPTTNGLFSLQQMVARFEVALWESAHISVDEFFDGISDPKPSPDSPIYRMFVKSGMSLDDSGSHTTQSLMNYSVSGDIESAPENRFTPFGNTRIK